MASSHDQGKPPANTIAMLGQAYSLLGFRIVEGVVGSGHPIKARYSAVFGQFDPGSAPTRRATELARGAGMSPQAMGELLDEMEELGYLRRDGDPSDRRAKLISMTTLGTHALRAGGQAIGSLEAEIARTLGDDGRAELRRLLELLLAEG
ncbi:MAG: MarR family transcriptional regulator [Pseudolysinimonas sp.]